MIKVSEAMDIYYEVVGEGFPIICLHGNGEDHHIFDDLKERLSLTYQLILIDSRYHGKSICQGELSYEQMVEDVKKVVDELHMTAYDVIGFSDGAIVSLLLGMQDQRLKHIVSIGANTKPQMIKPFYRYTFLLQRIFLSVFALYNPQAKKQLKFYQLMLKEPHIEYDDLQKITAPTLVLAGEMDMIQERDTQMIGESIKYSVVKIIKGGNHFLLRDYFLRTFKEIELFLAICHKEG